MIQHKNPAHLRASFLSLDSRQIYEPTKTAFFAVNGLNHDGHQYVESLYHKGVREFIVEESAWHGPIAEKASQWEQTNIYVVENSIATLQAIAQQHREQFQYPVIGITGSNGKTICKEWLATLCNNAFSVVKSPKSFNSQIGVPLSLWAMQEKHNLGCADERRAQMRAYAVCIACVERIDRPQQTCTDQCRRGFIDFDEVFKGDRSIGQHKNKDQRSQHTNSI